MRISDYARLAWRSIWERKGRTIGTIVGIIVAILALGIAMGVGNGFQQFFVKNFASIFGVNIVYVIPARHPLTDADIRMIESLPYVQQVVPVAITQGMLYVLGKPIMVSIIAISPQHLPRIFGTTSMKNIILQGQPVLTSGTALVGYYVAFTRTGQQIIFPGQRISIETRKGTYVTLTVSGILVPAHVIAYVNPNIAVFVDYNTYFSLFSNKREYDFAAVYVYPLDKVDYVSRLLRKLFPEYEVFNPRAMLQSFENFIMALQMFLAFVSGIGMLIVGLWMFDTMTISVVQRTREIGVLKAVGFSNKQIFLLVLSEALVISVIGILVGDAILVPAASFVKLSFGPGVAVPAVITPRTMILVSLLPLVVNIIATLAPAYRASRISPLQALRTE